MSSYWLIFFVTFSQLVVKARYAAKGNNNMDVVNFLTFSTGRCLDTFCVILDLVIWIVNRLGRCLSNMGSSLQELPLMWTGSTLLEYWNRAIFSFLTMSETVTGTAHRALHTLESWLQTLGGVLESFKMVGNLSSHVMWRVKEFIHRGLSSGNFLLRQTCEGFCIAFSLVVYVANTVINILLIGMQNCLSAAAGVWEAVSGPLHKALDLTLTLLTFLYSCLVGVSVLLWTPCQLALEFLGALGHVFITVFMLNIYGLLLTLIIVVLALLYLNPRLPRLLAQQSLAFLTTFPGVHSFQIALHQLYMQALEQAQAYQDRAGVQVEVRTGQNYLAERQSGQPEEDTRLSSHLNEILPLEQIRNELREIDLKELCPQIDKRMSNSNSDNPSTSSVASKKPLARGSVSTSPGNSLLNLLKEHEERKKCVICQDRVKNVLLLPCRHLCLCRHCSAILLQQPLHQHCCPLCRQTITQTMDVFL